MLQNEFLVSYLTFLSHNYVLRWGYFCKRERYIVTYVGAGVTVVSRKLEQSADRRLMAGRPSRVPVTARLQLLPAQLRCSRTEATATETRDRATANFIFKLDSGRSAKRSSKIGNGGKELRFMGKFL